ncbi:sensor histidine kinase [Zobellella maritima]|uniref:sensor histidine kinase n=1 Tax=Zobellella maritima TaxID=2059725 RepID=UPI000E2FF7E8|nr:ATP-binding protein [Zobellella maritima]
MRHSTPDTLPAGSSGQRITLLLLLLGMVLLAYGLSSWARNQAMEQARTRADANLSRYMLNLQHQLDRYKDLPRLLANQEQLVQLLQSPDDPVRVKRANRYLSWANDTMGATDSYLLDTDGITRAASNWNQPHSFIGNDYSFRPYFQQAAEGAASRYFALGNTSGVRGYFFSYPVRLADQIIGVVVVKVDLEDIEADWSDPLLDILVMDEDGVIFISTRAHWRFRTLTYPSPVGPGNPYYGNHVIALQAASRPAGPPHLTPEYIRQLVASRRYGDAPLLPLDIIRHQSTPAGDILLTLNDSDANGNDSQGRYLLLSRLMPDAGMRVAVLSNLRPLQTRIWQTLAIGLTLYLALAALVLFLQARHRLKQHFDAQLQQAHEALEQRVIQRTEELTLSNRRLQQEISQHRQTQKELIQAAKLAVLGQLSAGINHELNQPLTAIRHYADNGRKLLARNKTEAVDTNLGEITGLAERMARILQPLKEFARHSGEANAVVNLQRVRQGVMAILVGQLEKQQARINWPDGLEQYHVRADIGRLEQVLVNLLSNGLQAMAGQARPVIDIGLSCTTDRVTLTLHDQGPGLSPEALEHIFEPFYTTKDTGLGLGLSISQRIVDSLEGELQAGNHPKGGAVFTLTLKRGRPAPQPEITQ